MTPNAALDVDDLLEAEKARQGAELLSDILGGAPSYPPDGAPDLAEAVGAGLAARVFLDGLGAIHRVRRWDPPRFVRAYLRGAYAAWKPGTLVRVDGDILRATSPVCPIAEAAEGDPDRCAACQSFHREVARQALGPSFGDAWFERTIVRGDADCAFVLRLKREAP